jgi:peptidoglycan/LPS O-acetylase OafA/YrhL
MKAYLKFFLMMAVSFVLMYAVMYLNVFKSEHIYLSTTRTYMTFLMVCPMAVSMMLFMWKMYPNKKLNLGIMGTMAGLFILCLIGLRQQVPIEDEQWMKAMIPHHSSAVLTSSRANISDPEARRLADQIIQSQMEEIAEMEAMLKRMEDEK